MSAGEDARKARHDRDTLALAKAYHRMDLASLVEGQRMLESELEFLKGELELVKKAMPLCHCGQPGEPECPAHEGISGELEGAAKAQDALGYIKALSVVGYKEPFNNKCMIPWCPKGVEWDYDLPGAYCDVHGHTWMLAGLGPVHKSKQKGRGE